MSSIRILSSANVSKIVSTLSPETAIASQALVFGLYSTPPGASISASDLEGKTSDDNKNNAQSPAPAPKIAAIQTPHRLTISSEGSTMLFMPSRAPTSASHSLSPSSQQETTTTIKMVSNPTHNVSGLPATTLVMDESTGKVKAVINARQLTALRNAAGSALFLSLFPNPSPPQEMVIFGSGAQAYFHAQMILRLHPSLNKLTLVVRSSTPRSKKLVSDLSHEFGQVSIDSLVNTDASSEDLEDLVSKADIIVTVTPSLSPLFNSRSSLESKPVGRSDSGSTSDSLIPKAGTRLIMVGSYKPTMHEVDTALMKRAGIIVDSKEMCLIESGEIMDAHLTGEDLVEIGEIVNDQHASGTGHITKRVEEKAGGKEGVIIFKSVGLGIQDVAISKLVLNEAERTGLGTTVDDYDA